MSKLRVSFKSEMSHEINERHRNIKNFECSYVAITKDFRTPIEVRFYKTSPGYWTCCVWVRDYKHKNSSAHRHEFSGSGKHADKRESLKRAFEDAGFLFTTTNHCRGFSEETVINKVANLLGYHKIFISYAHG